jgi:hypothetical protein
MQRVYIEGMSIHVRHLTLPFGCAFALAAMLIFAAPGTARAADTADAQDAAGSTLIDIGGDVAIANLKGGMVDPVPLFVGPSGPAIFVIDLPTLTGQSDELENELTSSVQSGFKPPAPPGSALSETMGYPRGFPLDRPHY